MNIMEKHAIIEKWAEGADACIQKKGKKWIINPLYKIEGVFQTKEEAYDFFTEKIRQGLE